MRKSLVVLVLSVFFLMSCSSLAMGQESVRSVAYSLPGSELTVRGFYKGDTLEYDADGRLTSKAESGSWTEDGLVLIEDVDLQAGQVKFECRRAAQQQPANARIKFNTPLQIIVATAGDDGARLKNALDRIFSRRPEEVIRLVTPSEQGAVENWRRNMLTARQVIKPPRIIHREDPKMVDSGVVVLLLKIKLDGKPEVLEIVRGLSKRANEEAIKTAEKWRFEPAKRNGKPVETTINMEINFHRY